jgi:hypothetical protein
MSVLGLRKVKKSSLETDACLTIRGLGFSPAAVKDAAARAKRGESTEQILDALANPETTEAVAA